jgi:chitinase domain-containing protein 1
MKSFAGHSVFHSLLLVLIVNVTFATISPSDKKKVKDSVDLNLKTGPVDETVYQRGLVVKNPDPTDIIVESGAYYKKVNTRNASIPVLGYVTPWNNHGYDVAKIFASKFAMVSPVWLQIKRKPSGTYLMTGTHDIDHDWVREVKKRGKKSQVKILPRVLFDQWTSDDFYALFTTGTEPKELIKTLITSAKAYKFDGVVL